MYHVELRQFPHNLCRFNLTEREMHLIAAPWARGDWLDLGERKWSPHQAKLTVLEGERIPVEQLSIGRGWRNARRQSEDVTARVLAAALEGDTSSRAGGLRSGSDVEQEPAGAPSSDPSDPALVIDSLGPELLRALGEDSARLSLAWRAAIEESPGRPPSVCLALAEEAIRSDEPR